MSRANEPAFPREVQKYFAGRDDLNHTERDSGLTIREEFAKAAMQGLCANPGGPFQRSEMHGWGLTNCTSADVAMVAVELADALITELAKPVTP